MLYRDTVAPTGYLFGAVYGVALDDGLEIDRVVHEDAVKAKVVDMYCVVKGAFEDYWFGSGVTGAAHDKAYADSHHHSKPIEVAYHRAKPITLSKIIYT